MFSELIVYRVLAAVSLLGVMAGAALVAMWLYQVIDALRRLEWVGWRREM